MRAAYQPTSCLAPAVQEGWFREPGVSASQREQRMRIIPDFSSHLCFPAAATARGATASDRLLPSAVLLFDIKGVHFGKLYDGPRAREERAGAVAERAHQVGQEYRTHARRIDRLHGPFSTDVLDRLDRYGQVRGLCFGVYGEASGDVYHLIAAAAHQGAVRWGLYGARSQAEMRACLIARYRRRLAWRCRGASHVAASSPAGGLRRAVGCCYAAVPTGPTDARGGGAGGAGVARRGHADA